MSDGMASSSDHAARRSAHQRDVSRRFSSAAAGYDEVAQVQERVARRVLDLVPADLRPARVLDAGCGTGFLLALARARWPAAELVGVDIAPGMIRAARERLRGDARFHGAVADAARYEDAGGFDAILCSSALHWMQPLRDALAHLAGLLRPGGTIATGVMISGTLGELHAVRAEVAPDKAPRASMPEFAALCGAAESLPGLRLAHAEEVAWTLSPPGVRELLTTLRRMGVTAGDLARGAAPLTPRELRAIADAYARRYPAPGGGIRATFRIGLLALRS